MNLLHAESEFNARTQRHFYKYFIRQVEFDHGPQYGESEYVYDVPDITARFLSMRFGYVASPHEKTIDVLQQVKKESYTSPICESKFGEKFVGWYDELSFNGRPALPGHFSQKDGRFYHSLHEYPKERRFKEITWDGEPIVEAWDAHSAFFIVLGYYLRDVYDGEIYYYDEAAHLMEMAVTDTLYSSIQNYHNERAVIKLTREETKKNVQMYKNYQRKTLFRKDGKIKNCWWCYRFRYIDEFFKSNFPKIRNLLLDYPRKTEPDLKHYRFVLHDDGRLYYEPKTKNVSEITYVIMPHEFELISLGICRDLWDIYGIKSVTVHDAIYMKVSDYRRKVDIDHLLRCRLGLAESSETEQALF